jgi:AcrR family transcriptional regulator
MPAKIAKTSKDVARSAGGNGQSHETLSDSRFDRRLAEILTTAADVFFEKGYEGASMRDLSRRSGMSLAGLYYYFESKEKLLYLIQRHTFTTVLDRLRERLPAASSPEDAVRIMIRNHIEYFVANMTAMKVLSHEADTLKNEYGQEIQTVKREYYRICVGLLEELRKTRVGKNAVPPRRNEHRIAVLSLFGMMNWIYTWYNPQVDPGSEELADQMSDMFLRGVLGERTPRKAGKVRAAIES